MSRRGQDRSYEARLPEVREQAAAWFCRVDRGLSAGDRAALRAWLRESPAHALEFELIDGLYGSPELTTALATAERLPVSHGSRDRSVSRALAEVRRWLLGEGWSRLVAGALAAAVVLVIGLQIAPLPVWLSGGDRAAADPRPHILRTRNGQQMLAALPDGSELTLNGGTEVSINFTPDARHVELRSGDALFTVAHDPARPFLVATSQARVRVVGTKFLVSQTHGRNVIDVFEGQVRVRPRRAEMPSVEVRRASRVVVAEDVRIERGGTYGPQDWTAGWIDTETVTLGDLAELMRRRTGAAIRIAPEVRDLQVSGRFRITEPATTFRRISNIRAINVEDSGEVVQVSVAKPS